MYPASPDLAPAREGLAAGPAAKEPPRRCRLSVLFCDLCDSTALSGLLEPEEYSELLGALRQSCEETVGRLGGTVVRVQGDGMLAVFGHPLPREGDGRRAVEAALQLHEAVRAMVVPDSAGIGQGLRLHSGIHSGMVLVQGGDLVIGRLELLGMVPNIAARLSAAAGRDELLVSDETLGPGRVFFRTGEARHVLVHGHDTPVACWPVAGRAALDSPLTRRAAATLPRFIGRRDELRQLELRLGEVLAGATRQVALVGPPGVGKTRLAMEFVQRASQMGCRVLRGQCESELDAVPMLPVLQMLRGALGVTADAPIVAALTAVGAALELMGLQDLSQALLPLLDASQERASAMRGAQQGGGGGGAGGADQIVAVARLFATWAERQPLLLFVDDWHGSDAATRQALAAICAAAEAHGLMVVYSARSIDAGDATMRQVEVIPLAPFSPDEGRQSIHALMPRADPFVAEQIYRHSGGNPLFIEELCHSTAAAALGPPRLAGQQVGAAWLQVLIESRVARLPPEQAALVRTLAVIGNVVPEWLLTAVTGLAPGDEALQDLAHKDLLFPGEAGTLRFKHGLTRDVIYESVGLRERRALHLRIAQALQAHVAQGEHLHEGLAYHFGAAGHAEDASRHAELAGDRAAALSALDRAKALYHAALAGLQAAGLDGERTLRWLGIANKLGLICVFDASRRDLPVFERAVQLAQAQPDVSLQARAQYWLGYILYALGQARDAVAHCERASALAGPGEDPLAVQIRATLGQALAAASGYARAQPLLEQAVAVKRRHRRGSRPPVGLAYSLACLASVLGDRGEFEPAYELLDEAWGLVNGTTHEIGASITGWRAVILGWQGRWADALAAAQQSTRIAEQTHSLFQFCQGRATGAYAQWMLHGQADSIDRLAQSTQWLEPLESGLFRSLDHGWLTEGWLARGERALARAHAARALRRARAGDLIGVALAWRALARDAMQAQDFTRARRCLTGAESVAAQRDSHHELAGNALCAAEIALAAGDRAQARTQAESAAAAFERMGMHWHGERARELLARA